MRPSNSCTVHSLELHETTDETCVNIYSLFDVHKFFAPMCMRPGHVFRNTHKHTKHQTPTHLYQMQLNLFTVSKTVDCVYYECPPDNNLFSCRVSHNGETKCTLFGRNFQCVFYFLSLYLSGLAFGRLLD